MIAVTFALPAESRDFLRHLVQPSRTNREGIRIIRGKIDDRAVEILHTGVGERACQERLGKFLQDQQFDCLISSGFAGAINNDLKIGDLVVAKNFSTIDVGTSRSSLSNLSVHIAEMLTVPALIDSPQERLKLAHSSGAAAVDMETEFIARACATHGIPFLSLRIISDTPRDCLPASPNVLFDIEQQQTQMLRLATHLLTHPSRVPRLVRFARRIARARKLLADALVEVVRNTQPG